MPNCCIMTFSVLSLDWEGCSGASTEVRSLENEACPGAEATFGEGLTSLGEDKGR